MRSWLVATVVLAAVTVAVPAEAVADIGIANYSFTPSALTRTIGASVTWANQTIATAHTVTSNAGFFDSGSIAGGGHYMHAFAAAGAFAYHCTFHAQMVGKIRIPLHASTDAVTVGSHVTLEAADATVSVSATFDYQRKYGDGSWMTFRIGISRRQIVVTPKKAGTFRFRSRVHQGSGVSGWSPAAVVRVAAG